MSTIRVLSNSIRELCNWIRDLPHGLGLNELEISVIKLKSSVIELERLFPYCRRMESQIDINSIYLRALQLESSLIN